MDLEVFGASESRHINVLTNRATWLQPILQVQKVSSTEVVTEVVSVESTLRFPRAFCDLYARSLATALGERGFGARR